ncbi:hypothetical protein TNCV_3208691 [Trichonephila clavipes]|nr:hypothetical protein TNCV_3208691 [Trichonephila clavipes]
MLPEPMMQVGLFTIDGDTPNLHLYNLGKELEGREIFSSPLNSWFQLRPPTRLSDLLIKRARSPCVLGGYLVASGIESRPPGLESDTRTTRLPMALWSVMQ